MPKQFVDYSSNTANDTGEANATSIQPIIDGNPANAINLARPDESLRQRTEAIRGSLNDTLFLRDSDRSLVLTGPGTVTWPGSTTATDTGIPTISDVLHLLPMLTPGFAQTDPVPPVASAFGTLHLKRADSANAILVTSQRRSYASGDQISINVVAGSSFSCTLDTETGYQRTIHIVATGATQLSTVVTALGALTPASPDDTPLVTAALEGGALGTDLLLTTQAKQFVVGNYDGEGHTITPANLAAFFTGNPSSALGEGDTLGISFATVSDPASTGGRRQATPENANTAVPVGSFFNSRVRPDLLANALPICKVVGGKLVFGVGVEIPAGSVGASLSGFAAGIAYGGGGNWADGTTNPATTVEGQLDKVISDLAGATGTAKIQGAAVSFWLPVGTLAAQLVKIEQLARNPRPLLDTDVVPLVTYRDAGARPRSLVDHSGYRMGQVSECDETWSSARSMPLKIVPTGVARAEGTAGGWDGTGLALTANDQQFGLAINVPEGAIITAVTMYGHAGDGTGVIAANLVSYTETGGTASIVNNNRSGSGNFSLAVGVSPASGSLPFTYNNEGGLGSFAQNKALILNIALTGTVTSTHYVYQVEVDYLRMPAGWEALVPSVASAGSVTATSSDAVLRQASLTMLSGVGSTHFAVVRPDKFNEYFDDNTAYVVEFMLRTGTVDDASHGAFIRLCMVDDAFGSSQGYGFYWNHGVTNWQFAVESAMDLFTPDSVTSGVDTGVAMVANTLWRIRIEFEGANVAGLTTGQVRLKGYINGTLVATINNVAWTDTNLRPHVCIMNTSTGGPYDMRLGRVRRVWNHQLSNDTL